MNKAAIAPMCKKTSYEVYKTAVKKKNYKNIIVEIIAILSTLIIWIPVALIVINSLKNTAEASSLNFALPTEFYLIENIKVLLDDGNILTGLANSTLLTVTSTFLVTVLAGMTGYVIQRRKTKITKTVNTLLLLGIIIPPSIIPTLFLLNDVGMENSYVNVILVYFVLNYSVAVFIFTGYFGNIPRSLDESALIDGCGPFRMFFQIIFPLVKPVTVTVIIITFMAIWNDFGTSIYFLNSPEKYTLTLSTYFFTGSQSSDWNLVFANIVIATLPVVLVYIFLQKHIIAGMTSGSVKG